MSSEILTLTAEIEGAVKEAQAIIDAGRKNGLTAEKKTELDRLLGRTVELKAKVGELEHIEAKAKDIASLNDWLSSPNYKVPRPGDGRVGNGESETKTALSSMGWEVKGGIVYAPTSLGKMAEMYPAEVLLSDLDEIRREDPEAAEYFQHNRATFQPEYRKVYLKYLRMAIKMRDATIAFTQLDPAEQKALSEGTDIAGGYLVPPDVQAEVLVRLPMLSVMRQMCKTYPTSRDMLVFPMIQPNAGSTANGSIYTSAFVGDWAGETPAFADTDPKLGAFNVPVRKIRVATKISNDLVADSVFPFLSFLASDGSENMALVEDNGFINGQTANYTNGAGVVPSATSLQPLGLTASAVSANEVGVSGTTANTISNNSSGTGSWPKLLKVQASLPQQYQRNARWLWHRLTELNVRTLTDANLRPLWAPGYQGPTGSMGEQFDTFQSRPVYRSDFVPQDGTANALCVLYGDFSRYIIAQRAGISTTILRERFADTDQTGIILWERIGGALWNTDAFRFGIAS